jgi:glycosyltransferase involved in cell wall biosynthesis
MLGSQGLDQINAGGLKIGERIRVLLISGSYPTIKCGVGDYTAQLARALARRDDTEVCVLTDADARSSPDLDQGVQLFSVIHGWKFTEASSIIRKVIDWRPDVVHMQFGSSRYHLKILPWLMPVLLRFQKLTVVQTWHEWPEDPLRFLRNLPNALARGGLVVVKPEIDVAMSQWYRRLIQHKCFRFIPNASAIPQVCLTDDERALVRGRFTLGADKLVAFFGFANSRKGVEDIFKIVDPKSNFLVLVCELDSSDSYHRLLLDQINSEPWRGKVMVTGFLPPEEVGCILAAADAVVLPFPNGGGGWSTSTSAAVAQGTFVLVTSNSKYGYDPEENIYYAHPRNYEEMREAMELYTGRRVMPKTMLSDQWDKIADAHVVLYREVLVVSRSKKKGA